MAKERRTGTPAAVKRRANRRGVKMHSSERGRESAVLPLPMPFREALADYLKVKSDDAPVVLSKQDQERIKGRKPVK